MNSTFCFFCIFFFFFLSLFSHSSSDSRSSVSGLFCDGSAPPENTNFVTTFVEEMEALSKQITTQKWATNFINADSPMYGLAQCFDDLTQTDCIACYAAIRTNLPVCLTSISARIYLDGCFARYDNYSFYSESTSSSKDSLNCSSNLGQIVDETDKSNFVTNLGLVVDNVTRKAVASGGFGTGEVNGVFALGQCWKLVGTAECKVCLEKASEKVKDCSPKREGRALNVGCYLRYSTVKFYDDNNEEDDSHHGISQKIKATIISVSAAFLILSSLAIYAAYTKLSDMRKEHNKHRPLSISMRKSGLDFKYETLERATDYFSPSRKIGEGGASSVFKGTLSNGKTVAVKRLIYNTRQWVDEFFNEVNLVSGIQHKNLVKLLGCSIEGPESLLVFEYFPNGSLDQYIFDKNRIQILNWKQRLNIIIGTAEGLAHLHEGCEIRIIHRDIKSSNVLLDENLSPKISDFGLARCLAADKSHLSTGLAGTLGYMAPEYVIQGQLTEKADVYSFGVLVLEILTGRKNTAFVDDSSSLLKTVWKLYKSYKLIEAIDPSLRDDFLGNDEVSHILQIGLLCTQAVPSSRPSMVRVVQMLKDKENPISVPSKPPFLNAGMVEPGSYERSYGISSILSNARQKLQAPNTSSSDFSVESSNQNST